MRTSICLMSIVYCLLFFSCGSDQSTNPPVHQSTNTDSSFSNFSATFVEDLWKLYPGWASSQGYHKYDSVLVVADDNFHQKELAFASENLEALKKMRSYGLRGLNIHFEWMLTVALFDLKLNAR